MNEFRAIDKLIESVSMANLLNLIIEHKDKSMLNLRNELDEHLIFTEARKHAIIRHLPPFSFSVASHKIINFGHWLRLEKIIQSLPDEN